MQFISLVEKGITYTVFVKQMEFTRDEWEICSKISLGSNKTTVTVKCNQSLQGKYIEIVASGGSSETTLKVFEIERFGRFITFNLL